jgi:DNA-binding IclR family transcriptional regulator
MVTNYLRQRHFPSTLREITDEPAATVIDNAILDALEKQPFSSIRELAQLTCIPRSTVHRHLTQSLGFVVKHLRWVPHSLTAAQKAQHITLSNELLRELRSNKHQGWQFLITLNES